MTLTPVQVRAARAVAGLSGPQLAKEAEVSLMTIRRLESGKPVLRAIEAAIMGVFDRHGVEVLPQGARLKDKPESEK